MRVEPTSQCKQAMNIVSRRPMRSLRKAEMIEPSKEPPAILAVIPPCSTASGLWKYVLYSLSRQYFWTMNAWKIFLQV